MDQVFIINEIYRACVGVLEGDTPALKQYAKLCEIEKEIKTAKADMLESVQYELDKQPKTFNEYGYTFEKRAGGRMYDYKHLKEWQVHSKELKNCEERFRISLASNEKGLNLVSNEGEVLELPKVTYKRDSLIVKKTQ